MCSVVGLRRRHNHIVYNLYKTGVGFTHGRNPRTITSCARCKHLYCSMAVWLPLLRVPMYCMYCLNLQEQQQYEYWDSEEVSYRDRAEDHTRACCSKVRCAAEIARLCQITMADHAGMSAVMQHCLVRGALRCACSRYLLVWHSFVCVSRSQEGANVCAHMRCPHVHAAFQRLVNHIACRMRGFCGMA